MTTAELDNEERSALDLVERSRVSGATATQIGQAIVGWRDKPASVRQLGYRAAVKLIRRNLIYSIKIRGKTWYYLVVDTTAPTLG